MLKHFTIAAKCEALSPIPRYYCGLPRYYRCPCSSLLPTLYRHYNISETMETTPRI